jgi:hypothetical protein
VYTTRLATVVVHVDDASLGRDRLRDLVGAARRLANEAFGQTTCCQDGDSSECNRGWYIDQALKIVHNFDSYQGSAVSQVIVNYQIDVGRPLEVGVSWSKGGGHSVVIDAYDHTIGFEREPGLAEESGNWTAAAGSRSTCSARPGWPDR